MTIEAWRIVKQKHAASAFSGIGAKTFGGRWNSPGTAVVYLSGSTSLAMLEMLVHLRSDELLQRYVLFRVTFDASLLAVVPARRLPRNWRNSPPPHGAQRIGDEWVAKERSPVLRVPSVIAPKEFNYLLNPAHADFPKIHIYPREPIRFDPRLK